MTINATAAWLLGLYVANAEDQGVDADGAAGHDPERHRQGVPVAGARTSSRRCPAARLIVDMVAFCAEWVPQVEPDERLQLPPAGGGGDAGAGDRLLAGHRHRRARRGAGVGPGRPRTASRRWSRSISFFVNAGIRFVEETCKMRAFTEMWDRIGLERYGVTDPKAAPVPLRRAGQLARPHRGPAREQRAAHRARGARRHAVEARPGPVDPAAGVERGARPAPPVGPAVVAAHPAGAGLRDRPARVRRHLRRLAR